MLYKAYSWGSVVKQRNKSHLFRCETDTERYVCVASHTRVAASLSLSHFHSRHSAISLLFYRRYHRVRYMSEQSSLL